MEIEKIKKLYSSKRPAAKGDILVDRHPHHPKLLDVTRPTL